MEDESASLFLVSEYLWLLIFFDNNDIKTANKMLAVVSKGIAKQRSQKQNARIIELTTKQEIKFFERVIMVEK